MSGKAFITVFLLVFYAATPLFAAEGNAEEGTIFTLWPLIDYRESPREGYSNLSLLGYAGCADAAVAVDVEKQTVTVKGCGKEETFSFEISPFDKALVLAGGWVDYADKRY